MPSITLTPTAVVNDPSYGGVPWVNPDGFRVKNYGEATAVLQPGESTNYAAASYDCSTALPPGVTLTGIQVDWSVARKLTDVGDPGDASVRVGPGTPAGDDKARPAEYYRTTYTPVRSFGGDGDLWGTGLDADAVRANGLTAFLAARWARNPSAPAFPDGAAKPKGDQTTLTLYYV